MRAILHITLAAACVLAFLLGLSRFDAVPLTVIDPDNERWSQAFEIMKARHETVEALYAGRLTLADAAARFEALSAADPYDAMAWLRTMNPGRSDSEIYFIHVLFYVDTQAHGDPEKGVMAVQLRNEFESMRKADPSPALSLP
jgi:hypothetical protein